MSEARRKDEWDRTASIILWLVNIQLPKGDKIEPHQVHPFMQEPPPMKVGIGILKKLFVDRKVGRGRNIQANRNEDRRKAGHGPRQDGTGKGSDENRKVPTPQDEVLDAGSEKGIEAR